MYKFGDLVSLDLYKTEAIPEVEEEERRERKIRTVMMRMRDYLYIFNGV